MDVHEGKVKRLHAKERMAAAAIKADHREVQALAAAVRRCGGFAVVLCFARALMKAVDSVRQGPPIPSPSTIMRERPVPTSQLMSAYGRNVQRP